MDVNKAVDKLVKNEAYGDANVFKHLNAMADICFGMERYLGRTASEMERGRIDYAAIRQALGAAEKHIVELKQFLGDAKASLGNAS